MRLKDTIDLEKKIAKQPCWDVLGVTVQMRHFLDFSNNVADSKM